MDRLERYLQEAPVSIGLIRAIECEHIRRLNLSGRILDIGCGDGLFSEILFEGKEIDLVGMDFDARELKLAGHRGLYQDRIAASAHNQPFPDESFDHILSNSVLEHIPNPALVLSEITRLLKPGGKMIITVPSPNLEHFFFYTILLRTLGMPGLGKRYADFKNTSWNHHNVWPLEQWTGFLIGHGLEIEIAQNILSKGVTIIGDIMLPFAVPSVLMKRYIHRMLLLPSGLKARILAFLLRPFAAAPVTRGAGYFIVARKPLGKAS